MNKDVLTAAIKDYFRGERHELFVIMAGSLGW